MDGNSDPDRAKKKGGEILGWFFLFVSFFLTVKLEGEKRGGCYQNTIRHLSTKRITTN